MGGRTGEHRTTPVQAQLAGGGTSLTGCHSAALETQTEPAGSSRAGATGLLTLTLGGATAMGTLGTGGSLLRFSSTAAFTLSRSSRLLLFSMLLTWEDGRGEGGGSR